MIALCAVCVLIYVFFITEDHYEQEIEGERMVLVPEGILLSQFDSDSLQVTSSGMNVEAFYMDVHPVTVEQFRAFVDDTNYETSAEAYGNAGVFDHKRGQWMLQDGATWLYPQGPDHPKAENNHPVTQVSWYDAMAYCEWAGFRLPTETEWEYAARNAGAIVNAIYPWNSDNVMEQGEYKANFWQGAFPLYNNEKDGYKYTSPVGTFGSTPLGLEDMAGNVWEWCSDWKEPATLIANESMPNTTIEKVQRGGSFLCDTKVCHGFRVMASSASTPETSLMNVGFRCVKNSMP